MSQQTQNASVAELVIPESLRVSVTGSDGFVGGWLCQCLGIPSSRQWGKKQNPPFDSSDETRYAEIVRNTDVIIHLAAVSGIKKCTDNPSLAFKINGDATFNLAKAAKKAGVKKFIFASTSAVYGQPEGNTIHEGLTPAPQGIYGQSKFAGEKVLELADESFSVIVFRKSNLYGYGLTFKGRNAIDTFIAQYLSKKAFELTGDGSQARDFLHLMDAVNLYRRAAVMAEIPSGIYNLGGPENISILRLAETINQIGHSVFGYQVPITFKPEGAGVAWKDTRYDSSKAWKTFKYTPQFRLEDYLKERMLLEMRNRSVK